MTSIRSAKYIEGLENRMRRLEGLLKMAGLADSETDLPSIERRLQQAQNQRTPPTEPVHSAAVRSALSTAENTRPGSLHSTPPNDSNQSPRATDSPASQEDKEYEVEALSDMMCSLVTNNCGETRYIGRYYAFSTSTTMFVMLPQGRKLRPLAFRASRFFLRIFHLLTSRYPMGQRKDRRHLFSRYDTGCLC